MIGKGQVFFHGLFDIKQRDEKTIEYCPLGFTIIRATRRASGKRSEMLEKPSGESDSSVFFERAPTIRLDKVFAADNYFHDRRLLINVGYGGVATD